MSELVNENQSKRGVFFWIVMILLVVLVFGVVCCGSMVLFVSNEKFEQEFIDTYCRELEIRDDLDEDMMGWCD